MWLHHFYQHDTVHERKIDRHNARVEAQRAEVFGGVLRFMYLLAVGTSMYCSRLILLMKSLSHVEKFLFCEFRDSESSRLLFIIIFETVTECRKVGHLKMKTVIAVFK